MRRRIRACRSLQPAATRAAPGERGRASRSGAPRIQSARYSSRSRNVGSPQWMSSKTTTSGRSRRERLEEPPHRPERLLDARPRRRQADERRQPLGDELGRLGSRRQSAGDLRRAASAGGRLVDPGRVLDDLGDRPERDALAVGQAAAAERRSRRRPVADRNSRARRDLPTPAGAEDGDELAGAALDAPASNACSSVASSPLAADERRVEPARPARRAPASTSSSRQAATGSALPFSASGSDALGHDGVADEAVGRLAERISPGSAACSSRAATLTASPVDERLRRGRVAGDDLAGVDAGADCEPRRRSRARAPRSAPRARRASRPPPAPRAARRPRGALGTPKTAMTASPMNFSTVPPWRSTTARIASK